jgi:outer membrane protein assembly factor BamC
MQMSVVKAVLVSILLLSSTGCGYIFGDDGVFRDRSQDYKKAPETPPVSLPAGTDSVTMRDIYVIPPVEDKFLTQGKFEVPKPVPLNTSGEADTVRIQKLGDQSWVLIDVAPGQVWPQVRNFMAASGMQIARADARAGIMESNWLVVEGQPLKSRFRFRIEQGVQRGTSELHVLQMRQSGSVNNWPDKSDDPDQAAEMQQSIAQFLANSADSAPVSMIAEQGISASGKITMQEASDGFPFLRLELPFDRAWASVGRALEKSSFEIADRDRSSGIYYVRFLEGGAQDEQGWWSRFWDSDKDHPLFDQILVVSMETQPGDPAVTIKLQPQDVSVPFNKQEAQELLVLIKGKIN